jgi:hypothetical protein
MVTNVLFWFIDTTVSNHTPGIIRAQGVIDEGLIVAFGVGVGELLPEFVVQDGEVVVQDVVVEQEAMGVVRALSMPSAG